MIRGSVINYLVSQLAYDRLAQGDVPKGSAGAVEHALIPNPSAGLRYRIINQRFLRLLSIVLVLLLFVTTLPAREEHPIPYKPDVSAHNSSNDKSQKTWSLQPGSGIYRVKSRSNIRTGPGLEFPIQSQLASGTLIETLGRVKNRNWYLLKAENHVSGFIHASLLVVEKTNTSLAVFTPKQQANLPKKHLDVSTEYPTDSKTIELEPTFSTSASNNTPLQSPLPGQFQLGYLVLGMNRPSALDRLRNEFSYFQENHTDYFPIVAGSSRCTAPIAGATTRAEFESALINSLIEIHNTGLTNQPTKYANECIAVELDKSSTPKITAVNYFSVLSGYTIEEVITRLEHRFGATRSCEASYDRNSVNLVWMSDMPALPVATLMANLTLKHPSSITTHNSPLVIAKLTLGNL